MEKWFIVIFLAIQSDVLESSEANGYSNGVRQTYIIWMCPLNNTNLKPNFTKNLIKANKFWIHLIWFIFVFSNVSYILSFPHMTNKPCSVSFLSNICFFSLWIKWKRIKKNRGQQKFIARLIIKRFLFWLFLSICV